MISIPEQLITLIDLLGSVAIMLSTALAYGLVVRRWPTPTASSVVVLGCILGLICVIGITFAVEVLPGVLFDPRTVVLSVGTAFAGLPVGIVAGAIAGSYRAWVGGAGVEVGLLGVVMAVSYGAIFRLLVKRKQIAVNAITLLALGAAVHATYVALLMRFTMNASKSRIRCT